MQRLRSTFDPLRPAVQLAPVKPAIASGVRAAIATVGPPIVGYFLGLPSLSWMGLGGFLVALSDKGGAYRTRATVMGVLTVTAAISASVAAGATHNATVAVVLMLLWAVLGGLARVFGAGATSVGVSTSIVFAISAATPAGDLADALERGGYVLIGGAWAMVLALALWPIAYYRPARLSIAQVYRALADFADDIARYATRVTVDPSLQERSDVTERDRQLQAIDQRILFQRDPAHVRETLEAARATLATTRRGRYGESGRGERLLVILEGADQMFRSLVAIAELFEELTYAEYAERAAAALREAVVAYAETAREIKTVLEIDDHQVALPELVWSGDILQSELSDIDAALRTHETAQETTEGTTVTYDNVAHTKAQYEYATVLINRLQQYTSVVAANAATLDTERPVPENDTFQVSGPIETKRSLLDPLRNTLSFDSTVLRHAIRIGVVTAIAIWITQAFSLDHGYWVTLTVIVILQPYFDDTVLKAVQRVGGTILGGILAALLTGVLQGQLMVLSIVFILVVVSVSLISINYGVFAIFSTCTFILLAEVNAHDWHIIESRVINTLIGGALSLVAIRVFWPSWERNKFPSQMAAALRANSVYLRQVVKAEITGDPIVKGTIMPTRRQVGLAELNAEASFQRVTSESGQRARQIESSMAALLYTRRVSAAITALSSAPWEQAPNAWRTVLSRVAESAQTTLDSLAASIEHARKPDPLPNFAALLRPSPNETQELEHAQQTNLQHTNGQPADLQQPALQSSIFRTHIERLVRQLRVLHDAVQRMLEAA